jgi:diaminohydroxyphosphoribosylaminopyrimidine deaminase/5-amino-6-(5-phosphoribosylamino)uracil reductase
MVGALLVRRGRVIGRGWHRRAGEPHAEIEALRDASKRGEDPRGATLYVSLEPCCTHGRTPPCTEAIIAAGIGRVVAGATDPNPAHAGRGFTRLRRAGIEVLEGVLSETAAELNEAFNHWIVHRTPFVTLKSAMTLDGRIATAGGESRWITTPASRQHAMRLRLAADAILVGVNTILADDPSLTYRTPTGAVRPKPLRRIVLDSRARTPDTARILSDSGAETTTIVVATNAKAARVAALRERVRVLRAPTRDGRIQLPWLLRRLGRENVTHLLVEGGGEVAASFLANRLVQRVVFFFGPKILGDRQALKGVGGAGAAGWPGITRLHNVRWRRFGDDLCLSALVDKD